MIVVGASGLIGGLLMDEARRAGIEAIGTSHMHPRAGLRSFDLTRRRLITLAPDIGPDDWVVLLAAQVDPQRVSRNPEMALAVNVTGTLRLADEAMSRGAAVLFVSSEAVFDGTRGGYVEEDAPSPLTLYARCKVEVERALQAMGRASCIVRTGWTVDPREVHAHCPVSATYDALLAPGARMARDTLQTLTDAHDTALTLRMLMSRNARGIYHVAAQPPVARSELARWIVESSRQGARMAFEEIDFASLSFAEPRPARPWINGNKLRTELNLSFRAPRNTVAEKVALLDAAAEQPRRARR